MAFKHHKHGSEKKIQYGNYGRNELVFMGTTCSEIKRMCQHLIAQMHGEFSLAYLDAEHHDEAQEMDDFLANGASASVLDHQNYTQIKFAEQTNKLHPKLALTQCDLLLINGNHFEGNKQILALDVRKTDSLKRHIAKVTDVLCFVDIDGNKAIPQFILDLDEGYKSLPVFAFDDTLLKFLRAHLTSTIPPLSALILAGGMSTRMGEDKSRLSYHGVPQVDYLHELLSIFCDEVVVSTRPGQKLEPNLIVLEDAFTNMGPLGAILTAFRDKPNNAWLVLACDLPFVDETAIQNLIHHRSHKSVATAYKKTTSDLPEPLFAIWEPKAYARGLQMLSLGIQCPRKLLLNSAVKLIEPHDDHILMNVNSPEERAEVLKVMGDGNQ